MRFSSLALGFSAFLLAGAASAQTSPAPAPATATGKKAAAKDPNRMVCRSMDTTGSRLGKRKECRTANEWAEQAAYDRTALERQQANRGISAQ